MNRGPESARVNPKEPDLGSLFGCSGWPIRIPAVPGVMDGLKQGGVFYAGGTYRIEFISYSEPHVGIFQQEVGPTAPGSQSGG